MSFSRDQILDRVRERLAEGLPIIGAGSVAGVGSGNTYHDCRDYRQ